jgi:hypothetical protein
VKRWFRKLAAEFHMDRIRGTIASSVIRALLGLVWLGLLWLCGWLTCGCTMHVHLYERQVYPATPTSQPSDDITADYLQEQWKILLEGGS